MRQLSQPEQVLVTRLYRKYKIHPSVFSLTEEEKNCLLNIIDVNLFDIRRSLQIITYGDYYTDHIIAKKYNGNLIERGEEYRAVKEVISLVKYEQNILTLLALRKKDIDDKTLISAAYLHLGLAHNIISKNKNDYKSEYYTEAVKREQRGGANDNIEM